MFIHGLMDHPPPEQSPRHPAGQMLMVLSAPPWDNFFRSSRIYPVRVDLVFINKKVVGVKSKHHVKLLS